MKNTIILCILALGVEACFPIKESFIDIGTGEKIAGYDKDCKFQIGKTDITELDSSQIESLKDKIYVVFADDKNLSVPPGKLMAVSGGPLVVTKRGIKAGDSPAKALKVYGKPKAKAIDWGMDANGYVWWIYYGFFYKNMAIITDDKYETILGIDIGRRKEFDLKLQKQYLR